jgi:hypothetical protein
LPHQRAYAQGGANFITAAVDFLARDRSHVVRHSQHALSCMAMWKPGIAHRSQHFFNHPSFAPLTHEQKWNK